MPPQRVQKNIGTALAAANHRHPLTGQIRITQADFGGMQAVFAQRRIKLLRQPGVVAGAQTDILRPQGLVAGAYFEQLFFIVKIDAFNRLRKL
ncbi:hypothetical protein D3C72_1834290 [compost metagenome]